MGLLVSPHSRRLQNAVHACLPSQAARLHSMMQARWAASVGAPVSMSILRSSSAAVLVSISAANSLPALPPLPQGPEGDGEGAAADPAAEALQALQALWSFRAMCLGSGWCVDELDYGVEPGLEPGYDSDDGRRQGEEGAEESADEDLQVGVRAAAACRGVLGLRRAQEHACQAC